MKKIVLVMLLSLFMSGCMNTLSNVTDTTTHSKKARIIFNVPITVTSDQLIKAVYTAVSLRVDNVRDVEGFFPEKLPDVAESPLQSKLLGQLGTYSAYTSGIPAYEMLSLNTSNAFYTASGAANRNMAFNSQTEYYKAAIYPYKKGYKVYLYQFYQESADSIIGHLAKGAAESLMGEESALLFAAQARDKLLEMVPSAEIISQSPRKLENITLNAINKGY